MMEGLLFFLPELKMPLSSELEESLSTNRKVFFGFFFRDFWTKESSLELQSQILPLHMIGETEMQKQAISGIDELLATSQFRYEER